MIKFRYILFPLIFIFLVSCENNLKGEPIRVATNQKLIFCGNSICEDFENHNNCYVDCSNQFGLLSGFTLDTQNNPSYDLSNEMGLERTRLIVFWHFVQWEEGKWNWEFYDKLFDELYDKKISPIVTIKCTSDWAFEDFNGKFQSNIPDDQYIDDYKEFLRRLVKKYKDKVNYWQIENEIADVTWYPDNWFWGGTKEEYIDLLEIASTTIRETDHDAKIVLQGFADETFIVLDDPTHEWYYNVHDLFNHLMKESEDYVDVIDFHQYWFPELTERKIEIIKNKMDDYDYDKPIISTEAGDPDIKFFTIDDPPAFVYQILSIPQLNTFINNLLKDGLNYEERKQLAYVLKTHPMARFIIEEYQAESLVQRIAYTFSEDVFQIYLACIQDFKIEDSPDWYQVFMCMTDNDGRKKPQYYTYKIMIEKMKGLESVDDLSDDAMIYRFNRKDKKPLYIVWHDDYSSLDISYYIKSSTVQVSYIVTHLNSNNDPILKQPDIFNTRNIPISKTPIFIEEI